MAVLQAGWTYRAIMVNVRTLKWERALQLAQKHNTHVATVLLERRKLLAKAGRSETLKTFQQSNAETEIDEDMVLQRVQQEHAKEAAKASANPYS